MRAEYCHGALIRAVWLPSFHSSHFAPHRVAHRMQVVVLQVPNTTAEGGVTSVYLLGISHVAKSDCKRVRANCALSSLARSCRHPPHLAR